MLFTQCVYAEEFEMWCTEEEDVVHAVRYAEEFIF